MGVRRTNGPRAIHGVTLIEVLVALAIVAIVTASAAAGLNRAVERERFKTVTRDIASALRSARHAAVARQTEAVFILDVQSKTYSLDGDAPRTLSAPAATVMTLVTADTERVEPSSGAIRFFADGSSTGGTVTFALRDRERVVAVDWLTGRVEVDSK